MNWTAEFDVLFSDKSIYKLQITPHTELRLRWSQITINGVVTSEGYILQYGARVVVTPLYTDVEEAKCSAEIWAREEAERINSAIKAMTK